MLIYFIAFIISLFCVYISTEIVLLTKKTLDKSYKFFMFASIVFVIISAIKFMAEANIAIDISLIKYLELFFIILFLDGLIFMKGLIRRLENEKIIKKKGVKDGNLG